MPNDRDSQVTRITRVDHRYQIVGHPGLHLSECLLVFVYDDEYEQDPTWAYCTCHDWSPDI